jgi:hypothetical protein
MKKLFTVFLVIWSIIMVMPVFATGGAFDSPLPTYTTAEAPGPRGTTISDQLQTMQAQTAQAGAAKAGRTSSDAAATPEPAAILPETGGEGTGGNLAEGLFWVFIGMILGAFLYMAFRRGRRWNDWGRLN